MKRLVVSLLRLGDIMILAPALQSLKERYPKDELHLLINSDFSIISQLMPYVDYWHLFPRSEIQSLLGDPESPILGAFDELKEFTSSLNQYKFDEIINCTHNLLSAHLISTLNSKNVLGLSFFKKDNIIIHGEWFQVLNQSENEMPFHFSEVLLRAVGDSGYRQANFCSEKNDYLEKKQILLIQPFSNEEKKMWTIEKWNRLLSRLVASHLFTRIEILAAPFEKAKVESFIKKLDVFQVPIAPYVCGLKDAEKKLRSSQLLVTVDTSIKHLAAATDIKIVELALGSSRPEHTGAYRDDVLIFQSTADCYPCSHATDCEKSSHICGNSFPEETIAECIKLYLQNKIQDIRKVIEKKTEFRVWYTDITSAGSWIALALHRETPDDVLATTLSRQLALKANNIWQDDLSVGSRAFSVSEILKKQMSPNYWKWTAERLVELEASCDKRQQDLWLLKQRLQFLIRNPSDNAEFQCLQRELQGLDEKFLSIDFTNLMENNVVQLSQLSRVRSKIEQMVSENEYNRKFLRTLKFQMME